jgi:glycosyltransferase involved in cell wall biosynthesis
MEGIDVIIPCYNYSRYLSAALDSVQAQSFRSAEVVVVDDGSTDSPGDVCRRYPNVRYIRKENGGPSSARNLGLRETRSDHVLFLDADDLLRPDALTTLWSATKALGGQAGLVFGIAEIIACQPGTPGVVVGTSPAQGEIAPFIGDVATADVAILGADFRRRMLRSNLVLQGSALASRHCIDAVGGWDENLWSAEDQDLWLRVAARYQIGYVNKIVVTYNKHGDNLTDGRHWVRNHMNILSVQRKCKTGQWAEPELRRAAKRQYAMTAAHVAARCADMGDLRLAVRLATESVRHRPLSAKIWAKLVVYSARALLARRVSS